MTEGENNCVAEDAFCCDEGFHAAEGLDPATGFGSVDYAKFEALLTADSAAAVRPPRASPPPRARVRGRARGGALPSPSGSGRLLRSRAVRRGARVVYTRGTLSKGARLFFETERAPSSRAGVR